MSAAVFDIYDPVEDIKRAVVMGDDEDAGDQQSAVSRSMNTMAC